MTEKVEAPIGLSDAVKRLGATGTPAATASAVELVLEGLHLNRRLNRDAVDGGFAYRRDPPKPVERIVMPRDDEREERRPRRNRRRRREDRGPGA